MRLHCHGPRCAWSVRHWLSPQHPIFRTKASNLPGPGSAGDAESPREASLPRSARVTAGRSVSGVPGATKLKLRPEGGTQVIPGLHSLAGGCFVERIEFSKYAHCSAGQLDYAGPWLEPFLADRDGLGTQWQV